MGLSFIDFEGVGKSDDKAKSVLRQQVGEMLDEGARVNGNLNPVARADGVMEIAVGANQVVCHQLLVVDSRPTLRALAPDSSGHVLLLFASYPPSHGSILRDFQAGVAARLVNNNSQSMEVFGIPRLVDIALT